MKKNSSSGERASLGKRKTDNFSKFYNKKRNSAVKEAFRQEKKAEKKEREQAIKRHFEERRKARTDQPAPFPRKARPDQPAPARPTHEPRAAAPVPGKRTLADKPARPFTHGKPAPGKPAPISAPTHAKPAPTRGGAPTPVRPTIPVSAKPSPIPRESAPTEILPLNKYISNGGLCSRRDAAELVRKGKVTVNGKLITEPGTKVHPTDTIKVNNKKVTISNNFVYILLNKPKDYITTTEDPQGRRTVFDLIRPATTERVFPVGRLDRNTSGVLLFTNDGDLAQKLAHPSHQIRKIYHVTLDKPLTKADFDKIASGTVTLEDGPAPIDDLAYADPGDKTQIGLEIHSGRNRIVRRIFEHLGYDVRGLDRVMYAGLTKKNVQRSHWRLLNEKEIRILKYLNSSFKGSPGRAKDMAAPEQPASSGRPKDMAPEQPASSGRAKDMAPEQAASPTRPKPAAPHPAAPSNRSARPHPAAHAPRKPKT